MTYQNRTIIVERDSRELTTRVVEALNVFDDFAEQAIGAQTIASLPALQSDDRSFPVGTALLTRNEQYSYSVVAAPSHVTTAAPAYLRVLNTDGVYPIRAFGVKGNGTTDDSSKIQAAVNEAGVCRLNFDRGTYRFADIVVPTGVEIAAVNGSSEVTANASGTTSTGVAMIYNGAGGAGSRMFTFEAPVYGQWIKGGGILGFPHISGNNLCETLIDARSTHRSQFDVELSRAVSSGMSLNAQNGALSQFNRVNMSYVYGASAATEASHGLVMNGNNPAGGFFGCTQNTVWTKGLIHDGDMVRMVGHCDNNHMWLHGSRGLGVNEGTGRTLSINQGNAGVAARVNHIHYACGSIFLQVGSFGTHFDFLTSEGMTISGGGQFTYGRLIDYINGKTYTAKTAPATENIFVSAAEMFATGAAVKSVAASTGSPIITLPKSADGGAAFSLHDNVWGAGTITAIEWIYRLGAAGTGNAMISTDMTIRSVGSGLTTTTFTEPVAANGTTVVATTRTLSQALPARGFIGMHSQRLPANGADTLASDLQLLGANVRIDFNGPASLGAPLPAWQESV